MHEIQTEDIGELTIELRPNWGVASYRGTRLQLMAEGLVPDDFAWPDGFARYSWTANGIDFGLVRQRPPGAKGPQRLYFDCDHWRLSMEAAGGLWKTQAQCEIRMLERKLADMKHCNSEAGKREWRQHFDRMCCANRDVAFQAFKTSIPALTPQPKNRGGRPRKEAKNV